MEMMTMKMMMDMCMEEMMCKMKNMQMMMTRMQEMNMMNDMDMDGMMMNMHNCDEMMTMMMGMMREMKQTAK